MLPKCETSSSHLPTLLEAYEANGGNECNYPLPFVMKGDGLMSKVLATIQNKKEAWRKKNLLKHKLWED